MRRTRVVLAVLLTVVLATPAAANVPDSFHACAKKGPDARCRRSIAVPVGRTVILKGKVEPPHRKFDAELWHQSPDLEVELLATVPINEFGKMKFVWETTADDGSQTDPNWFQFKIPGHGESNDVQVMVFFGE